MTAAILNIHEFYNELKGAGFTEQQAEVIANIQGKTASTVIEKSQADIAQVKHDYRLDDVATKRDLKETEAKLELKIELVRAELKRDIETIRKEISETKSELIKTIVLVSGIQLTIIAALLLKLVH